MVMEHIINLNFPKHDNLAAILQYITKTANIPNTSYCILGSYALRYYIKREISDLDVDMSCEHFYKLRSLKFGSMSKVNKEFVWTLNCMVQNVMYKIEIYQVDPNVGYPTDYFAINSLISSDATVLDKWGHHCYNLNTSILWKKIVNRSKDVEDLQKVTNFI
jgi:hypothetical protein